MNSITYMYRNENQIKQVNLSIICACHHIVRTAAVLGGNELSECAQCPPHHGVPCPPSARVTFICGKRAMVTSDSHHTTRETIPHTTVTSLKTKLK